MNSTLLTHKTSCQHTVECLQSIGEFEAVAADLDKLCSVPFLQSSWMVPWTKVNCGRDIQLRLLVVRNSKQDVIGYAPLVLRDTLKRARHLTFIGSGKACADYMTFPTVLGEEEEVVNAVSQYLIENSEQWDRVELDGVDQSNQLIRSFVKKMNSFGCDTSVVTGLPSYRANLPENWDAFLNSLSRNSRKKFRRIAKRLQGQSELHRAEDEVTLSEGLEVLETLHTARWNSLGGSGCFAHPKFREFLEAMAFRKMDEGRLSLIWLTFAGRPVAADIGYFGDGGFFTYQGGICPDHLDLEPGKAILKSQMELAMQRGAKFIDFLRGDEPYKSRFPTERIENVRYEIVGHNTRGRMAQSMLKIGRSIKMLVNEDSQSGQSG